VNIRIIRLNFLNSKLPAGEIFDFTDIEKASEFFWGKDTLDYLVVIEGMPVRLVKGDVFDMLTNWKKNLV